MVVVDEGCVLEFLVCHGGLSPCGWAAGAVLEPALTQGLVWIQEGEAWTRGL